MNVSNLHYDNRKDGSMAVQQDTNQDTAANDSADTLSTLCAAIEASEISDIWN